MGKLSLENAVKESQEIIESLGGFFDEERFEIFTKLVAAGRIRSDGSAIYYTLSRPIMFAGQQYSEVKVSDPIRGAVAASDITIENGHKPEKQTALVAIYIGQSIEFVNALPNADTRRIGGDIIPIFL